MAITKAAFRKLALSFPEAHEKLSYGEPAIFIAKRFFTAERRFLTLWRSSYMSSK